MSGDEAWVKLRKQVDQLGAGNSRVHVGIIQSKGGGEVVDGLSLVELAAIHEFGSPAAGIPERSFIRSTVAAKKDEIEALQLRVARQFVAGKLTADQALGLIGAWLAAEIRRTIVQKKTTGPEPQENAPSTIAAKGSSTPLVDTGRLINAIAWVIDHDGSIGGGA